MLRVISPGMFTTIQDLGRPGYAHLGISAGGAADPLSFRAGNLLAGNDENAPALEMTLVGGTFEFDEPAIVVLTGAEFEASLRMWTPVRTRRVQCGPARTGARAYLCVRGGLDAKPGSALRRGDALPIGTRATGDPRRASPPPAFDGVLRCTAGPQRDWFGDEFYRSTYTVSEDSNRRGIRLRGPNILCERQMITEGVSLGAVQIPPGGEPIVLFVDQQTTGGYPKIANVISADVPALGQLRPRDTVRFEEIGIAEAIAHLRAQEEWLRCL